MSTVTPFLNLIKAAIGEKYSLPTTNGNLDKIDAQFVKDSKAKQANFSMVQARTSTVGAGVNFGHLKVDNGRGNTNPNNDFCTITNTGTLGNSNEAGKITITKEGIYNLSANYTATSSPGALSFAISIAKIETGVEKITMSRDAVYGDWEANVSETGRHLKVGDIISGYQANGNGATWACGLKITYVGDNS